MPSMKPMLHVGREVSGFDGGRRGWVIAYP
jgi:hypothetical protein